MSKIGRAVLRLVRSEVDEPLLLDFLLDLADKELCGLVARLVDGCPDDLEADLLAVVLHVFVVVVRRVVHVDSDVARPPVDGPKLLEVYLHAHVVNRLLVGLPEYEALVA